MKLTVPVAVGLALAALGTACKVIKEDEVGVVTSFGSVSEELVRPGLALHLPTIREVEVRSVGVRELEENVHFAAREGLIVRLDLVLRFRVEPDRAPELERSFSGTKAVDFMLVRLLRDTVRARVGGLPLQEIHAEGGREEITRRLEEELRERLDDRGIALVDLRVRDVELPPSYQAARAASRGAEAE